jgi:hypothetical protein
MPGNPQDILYSIRFDAAPVQLEASGFTYPKTKVQGIMQPKVDKSRTSHYQDYLADSSSGTKWSDAK